jgi:hypothetical protein
MKNSSNLKKAKAYGPPKIFAQGFIVASSAICLLETWALQGFYLNPWVGYTLFPLLAVPLAV